jgi:hypothetical protein
MTARELIDLAAHASKLKGTPMHNSSDYVVYEFRTPAFARLFVRKAKSTVSPEVKVTQDDNEVTLASVRPVASGPWFQT